MQDGRLLVDKSLDCYLPYFQTAPHVWIAYSGGLDSAVLLHAMHALAQQYKLPNLQAIHINHGWHPDAAQWAIQCQTICQQLTIPCHVMSVNAQPARGESPEACARTARYAAFASLISANDCLLTAHQQDDQAETLLLQLFRGAGVKGLASMPTVTKFAAGLHLRPLLSCSRKMLENYAQQHNIEWIQDDSNQNLRFNRNFIRHELMPHIQERWPQIATTLTRVAGHCAEADSLLQQLAAEDLAQVQGITSDSLSASKLRLLGELRYRNVLRYWLHSLNFSLPSKAQLQRIEKDILHSKNDAKPNVSWGNVTLSRHRDNIFVSTRM
jgi:tRNA(Ile)-lysidine synthase